MTSERLPEGFPSGQPAKAMTQQAAETGERNDAARREATSGDLALLHRLHGQILHAPLTSPRPRIGVVLLTLKRWLRRLLVPSLEPQLRFNAASARLVTDLVATREELRNDVRTLRADLASLRHQNEEIRRAMAETLRSEVQASQVRITADQEALRERLDDVQAALEAMRRDLALQLEDLDERRSRAADQSERALLEHVSDLALQQVEIAQALRGLSARITDQGANGDALVSARTRSE